VSLFSLGRIKGYPKLQKILKITVFWDVTPYNLIEKDNLHGHRSGNLKSSEETDGQYVEISHKISFQIFA
jgi:hypothetical protein